MAIIIGGFLTFAYWIYWPNKVIEIHNAQAIQVDKKEYRIGDRISYTIDYCKYTEIQGIVSRSLVDGFKYNYSDYKSNVSIGCKTVIVSDMVIPDYLTPGIYHIETLAEYKINPLRNVEIRWKSVDFKVVK